MKFLRLVPCLCLLLAACGPKPAPPPATPPPTPAPTPTPAASPTPAPIPTAGTPEQIGSTLRLRIAFGGLPPRDTVAALLHRDELADPTLTRGKNRFALALLKGWTGEQLRGGDARLIVYRNKVNDRGDTETLPFPAALVQFDPATSLGVVAYTDTFDSASDVGFHLERADDPARSDALLLRTVPDSGVEAAFPARPPRYRPQRDSNGFSVMPGAYRGAGEKPARVEWPAASPQEPADPVALAVAAPDGLRGFVETAPTGPVFTGWKGFAFRLQFPSYEVTGVRFEDPRTWSRFDVILSVRPGPGSPAPKQLRLHSHEVGADGRDDAVPANTAGPVSPDAIQMSLYSGAKPGWRASVIAPPEGQDKVYSLQLSWPLLSGKDGLEIYGQPFRIRAENRSGAVFPTVLDPARGEAERTATSPAAAGVEAAKFPLEAAALDIHLVEGGREALLHLDGAPYWKRFSFEKNDWAPLPDPTANQIVTGNLTALFVLDCGLHTVRKYRLPGLEPAGEAVLPPGNYVTILAGSDSEHAPVHVVTDKGVMALDPDTLQRRDIPLLADGNSGPGFPSSFEQETVQFFTSGDGLAIVRLHGGTGDALYYHGDVHGYGRGYMGPFDGGGFAGEVPGVSGGWSVGNGVRCLDLPDLPSTSQDGPAAPWTHTFAALAENAPVVFRLLRPGSNELPPRMRLGCFALFGTTPFAEVEAPELAGSQERSGWARERWVFLDPYTRRLATVSVDRRAWFVRPLGPIGERTAPALLNWPDTTLPRWKDWTFQPVLTKGGPVGTQIHGRSPAASVDAATGAVSLLAAPDFTDPPPSLNLQLPGPDAAAGRYPVPLHADGLETPFALPPAGESAGITRRRVGSEPLVINGQDGLPLKAALLRFSDPVTTLVGPVAGCAAMVTESGRVDFLSVETRQVVGSFPGAAGATYYAGAGALLEYDPARRTLTRVSVPDGRREQTLLLPAHIKLEGIGAGTERGSPLALALSVNTREGNTGLSDLALPKKSPDSGIGFETVALIDGTTLKAGTRAQPVSLPRLLGKPANLWQDFTNQLTMAGGPPTFLPASRDGSVFNLASHFLIAGPSYAVAYPRARQVGGEPFLVAGGLAGGSLTGTMAFSGSGQAYNAGVPIPNNFALSQPLGATPDGRYTFYLLHPGANDTSVEVRSAENGRPLLRLNQLALAEQVRALGAGTLRRVWSLGEHGPLAVLSTSGLAMELVDLDIPALARQLCPQDFHVVSQPLPYVMEGRAFQYTVRVNNPAAVRSVHVQTPAGASLGADGTVSVMAPGNITAPAYLEVVIEITSKSGQTLRHEFPVCVLPAPRPGVSPKTGEL